MTILEKKYYVVWNCERNCAQIIWCPCKPKEEAPVDFVMDGDKPMDFSCELKAHEYLVNLKHLDQTGDPDAWRKICEE